MMTKYNSHTQKALRLLAVCMLFAYMAFALAGCGGKNGASGAGSPDAVSLLSGDPAAILDTILDAAAQTLPADSPMPMTFLNPVAAETAQSQIGLSAEDFDRYVSSATVATAAIATFAHEVGIIEAKDAASAAEVKKLIVGDDGYDSRKWICVFPELSSIVESGPYVLLAVSRRDVVEAVVDAFAEAAGTTGERQDFFTFEGSQEAGAGGMGAPIGLGPAPL